MLVHVNQFDQITFVFTRTHQGSQQTVECMTCMHNEKKYMCMPFSYYDTVCRGEASQSIAYSKALTCSLTLLNRSTCHSACDLLHECTNEAPDCVRPHFAISVGLRMCASGCIAEQACICMLTALEVGCTASMRCKLMQWGLQVLGMQCCIATSCPMKMRGA